MTMTVAIRPSPYATGERALADRAVLVGCDYPFCERALKLPVNLQSSDNQCRRDALRYLHAKRPNGWYSDTRGTIHYCGHHADEIGGPATVTDPEVRKALARQVHPAGSKQEGRTFRDRLTPPDPAGESLPILLGAIPPSDGENDGEEDSQ
jgi:hypothetical protein